MTRLLLLTGSANPTLAQNTAHLLNLPLANASIGQFSDGESRIEILENVRGQNVFIIQPTSLPPNHHLMELLLIADALHRAKARHIIAVVPYLSYMRQDKSLTPAQTPIGAKVVANLLEIGKFDRIVTIDLHSEQLHGFFSMALDNLYSTPLFLENIRKKNFSNPVIISPDIGGVKRARSFAQQLSAPLAIIDKHRFKSNKMQAMNVIGDIEGRECIIIDDIIDSANTICSAAALLKKNGATQVIAYVTHPVLSNNAINRIQDSSLDELIVTDTIPLSTTAKAYPNINILSIAPLLSEVIATLHAEL